MAMTPEEKTRFENLEKLVQSLYRVENTEFAKNIARRITFPPVSLSDLSDVDTTGVTDGQVIKYVASTGIWENANDEIV